MSWEFKVGQRIVCVNDVAHYTTMQEPISPLKKGEIYTIRWIGETPHQRFGPAIRVRLAGIREGWPTDQGFRLSRFRPLEEKRYSIEIFRKIASDVSEKKIVGDEITALQDMLDEHLPVDFHQYGGRPIL